jgi:hypothetical protein
MRNILVIAILVFGFIPACAQNDIRAIDFNNFTYEPECTGEEGKQEKITVKNSEFSSEKKMEDYIDRFYFKVFHIAYGELTGDKAEEAIVLTTCNTGGTGYFTEGFVFSMKGEAPVLLTRIPGGDRADGGLRDAKIDGGLLSIEFSDPENNAGACCAEWAVTQKLKLVKGKLTEVGQPVKRELFPRQPVQFARGESGTTLTLDLLPDSGARLVLGARAGQTLTVTMNTDKADAYLMDSDGTPEGVGNGFRVKLTKSGDQVVQIRNNAEGPLTVIVTIKIT